MLTEREFEAASCQRNIRLEEKRVTIDILEEIERGRVVKHCLEA